MSASSVHAQFEQTYRALLAQTASQPREQVLAHAYALGRSAAKDGMSISDVLMTHQRTAAEFVMRSDDATVATKMADLLLQEALGPFDVILGGIEEANASLRNINQLLELESRRIGQALHDEAGQLIATLSLAVECFGCGHQVSTGSNFQQIRNPGDPEPIEAPIKTCSGNNIDHVRNLVGQAEMLFRRLSHELRPVVLDDMGLFAAIKFLADGFSLHRGLVIDIQNELTQRLCPLLEWSIYRMIQVTLPNVVKHGKANHVTIRLAQTDDWIKCSVTDDGVGLDASRLQASDSNGIGLVGVRERAEALGGRIVISPVLPHGTDVSVYLPFIG